MSKKNGIKTITFRVDECELSQPFNRGNPKNNPFVDFKNRSESLLAYIAEALRKQVQLPEPHFQELSIQLSENPSDHPELFKRKFLSVDVHYDPADALRSPSSEKETAEKFIGYLEGALDKASQDYVFDKEAFSSGIEAYRKNGYQVNYRTAHGKLGGLGVCYEVCGSIGPRSSSAKIILNQGQHGEVSFEFWTLDEPHPLGATGFSKVAVLEDCLLISHQSRIFDDIRIPLDQLGLLEPR